MEANARQWVTVATYDQPTPAHAARLKLEDEGVTCFIDDENIGGLLWHMSVAVGGIKLKVPEYEAGRAEEILAGHDMVEDETGSLPEDSASVLEDVKDESLPPCPACHSEDTETYSWSRRVFHACIICWLGCFAWIADYRLTVLLLGVVAYFMMTKPDYRCLKCGKRWNQAES